MNTMLRLSYAPSALNVFLNPIPRARGLIRQPPDYSYQCFRLRPISPFSYVGQVAPQNAASPFRLLSAYIRVHLRLVCLSSAVRFTKTNPSGERCFEPFFLTPNVFATGRG